MYGFGEELTKENIFKRITSYDIFKFYSENFQEVGKSFCSDLPGREDKNPSAQVAFIKGDLLYSDFGIGKSYRAISYVMEKCGLKYPDALRLINRDFRLGLGVYNDEVSIGKPIISTPTLNFKEKTPSIILKKRRDFTKKDLEYWNSFYWTEDMLNLSGTQSISHYWIDGNMWTVKPNELAFSYEYYYHNGRMQRKLYFPERKEYKWFSNVDNTIVQLVNVAPKSGDILFITSSKKDAGIFWRMQLDNMVPELVIHGVAPNAESVCVPLDWLEKMRTRWKRIIIWYDNDWDKKKNWGVINAKKYAEQYNLEYYYNPDNEPKDPSDFSKKYSLIEFSSLIKSKICIKV